MTDAIGTFTPTVSTATARAASVAAAPQTETTTSAASTLAAATKPLSPRMVSDPVTGVMITEYFNSQGNLQAQLPSAAAVAYLRMGLTAKGGPKEAVGNTKQVVA